MKKLIALLATCVMAIGLVACVSKPAQGDKPQDSQPVDNSQVTENTEKDPEPEDTSFETGFWQSNIYYNTKGELSFKLPEEMTRTDVSKPEFAEIIDPAIKDYVTYHVYAKTGDENASFAMMTYDLTGDAKGSTAKDVFDKYAGIYTANYGTDAYTVTDGGVEEIAGREFAKYTISMDMMKDAGYKSEDTYYLAQVGDHMLVLNTYVEFTQVATRGSQMNANILAQLMQSMVAYQGK